MQYFKYYAICLFLVIYLAQFYFFSVAVSIKINHAIGFCASEFDLKKKTSFPLEREQVP